MQAAITKPLDALLSALQSKEVVFFAGAGLGADSGLVQVNDVFAATYDAHFPSEDDGFKHIAASMQPEQFYSTLLDATNDESCLLAWNALNPTIWESPELSDCDYRPVPNIAHHFIVAYSNRAGVPIFTVNYDLMFEEACELQGIEHRTVSEEPLEDDLGFQGLLICKVHGSISRTGDNVSGHDIATTMESISRKSNAWLDFIFALLSAGKRICFAGYSGRDIDYCPHFIEYYRKTPDAPKPFWTMSARSAQEIMAPPRHFADQMNSIIVPAYLGSILKGQAEISRIFPHATSAAQMTPAQTDNSTGKTELLARLTSHIKPLDSETTDYFKAAALHRIGSIKLCEEHLRNCRLRYGGDFSGLSRSWMTGRMLRIQTSVLRERADFVGYRNSARAIARWSRSRADAHEAESALLNAQLEIASSFYMTIPQNLGYKTPLFRGRLGLKLLVRIWYGILNRRFIRAVQHGNESVLFLSQECKIRTLAWDLSFAKTLGLQDVKRIAARLLALREEAYEAGNYITSIGTLKYLFRIMPENHYDELVNTQGRLAGIKSFLSTSYADQGNYEESIHEARENGNTLNLIKGYFKKAKQLQDENQDQSDGQGKRCEAATLSQQELEELDNAIDAVTPKSLKRTLRMMRRRHITRRSPCSRASQKAHNHL